MLATFQVIRLQELVFCAAACSQANRLFKVKGILNEAEIAVFSGGQLHSCSGVVLQALQELEEVQESFMAAISFGGQRCQQVKG